MMAEPFRFTRSRELLTRAVEVIPRGIYGTKSPALVVPGSFPYYAESGAGCRFRDVDGNEYIDFLCGFGGNLLGYGDRAVDDAAAAALRRGFGFNTPCPEMVELAEDLSSRIAGMDWALFGVNGSDMTTYALQTARAHTGRRKLLAAHGAYHGAHPWAVPGHAGLLEEDLDHVHRFRWNDLDSVACLFDRYPDDVAAVMVTPYHHPAFADSELPAAGFLDGLCALAHDRGALVISDDIRVGFRAHLQGSHVRFGYRPDLCCYSKAIANGYPIAACVGRDDVKGAASRVFCTGTFWMHAYPMAAALACLRRIERDGVIERVAALGERLIAGLHAAAARHGQRLSVTGLPAMPFVRFANETDFHRSQLFCAETTRRGAYFHPHHNWFLSAAHTEADIDESLQVADQAMCAVAERFGAA